MTLVDIRVQGVITRARLTTACKQAGLVPGEGKRAVLVAEAPLPAAEQRVCFWRGRRPDDEMHSENPFTDPQVRHWLGDGPVLDPHLVQHAVYKALANEPTSMGELLGPEATIDGRTVTSTEEKRQIQGWAEEWLGGQGADDRAVASLTLVLDELLTNALYNAPVDSVGRPVSASVERTVHIESSTPVDVSLGVGSSYGAVRVYDALGSFDLNRFYDRLGAAYEPGAVKFEDKPGGAGLGLFMVLQNASVLVLNLSPGRYTEFIVARSLGMRGKTFARTTPSIHVWSRSG